MKPIQININPERDGCYYELEPLSRRRVREVLPDGRVAPMVWIGYKTRQDFEAIHGPMWQQIATALTGLPWERIVEMGGIELYDVNTHTQFKHLPERAAA